MAKFKAGVIGTGWIAISHIHCYNEMDDVEVIAICDVDEKMAKEVSDKYGYKEEK